MYTIISFMAQRAAPNRIAASRLLLTLTTLLAQAAWPGTLTIDITQVAESTGTVHVEIMNKAAYKTSAYQTTRPDATTYTKLFPVAIPAMQVVIPDVPPGRYAVRIYQDLDEDSRLDTNYLGGPSEPYGYSNDAHTWFGKPGFGTVAITVPEAGARIAIRLQH